MSKYKKYVLSNSESVQCNFFFHFWSRDVHPVQNLLLCTKFHENRMLFVSLRNDDISILKMAAVRHLGIGLRDHPRSLCCLPPVKFHVNVIHRSEYIAIWIFRIIWLENAYCGRWNKMSFGGLWTPKIFNVIILHRDPQNTHQCVNPRF